MPDIFWEVWMPNFGSEKITFFRFFMIRSCSTAWYKIPLKGFCQFTSLRSNFLWVFKKTVLRAQISVSNNFWCFEKLWRSSFVLCWWKIHIMVFRWPTWIFVSNLIHFVQKHPFYSRGSESDFQRLRVLSFDPRANFASPLMFGFFSNFS